MTISIVEIDAILAEEDAEGFIAAGAPRDEYTDEAAQIAAAIAHMSLSEHTYEHVISLVSIVWTTSFDLSAADMEQRLPSMATIARRILEELSSSKA